MKENQYNFNVSDSGKMRIQGRESFDKELQANKGKRGVIEITFYDERDSTQIIKFYFAYIIPKFRDWYRTNEGLHLTSPAVNDKLMDLSSITKDLEERNIYKLSVIEVWYYIEDIKKIAAENFNLFIV